MSPAPKRKPAGKAVATAAAAPAAQPPADDREIDLDAARAARAELAGPAPTVKFGGKILTLPVEMPLDFALLAAAEKFRDAIGALLGDQADVFFGMAPSIQDVFALIEMASSVYGLSVGESEASDES